MTRCASSSASRPSTRCRTGAPRSSSAAARSPSRIRSSATTCPSYERAVRGQAASCSRSCSSPGRSRGGYDSRRRSPARRCIRRSSTGLAHLGWRRRQPRVGRPRGAIWPAADAGHHRRQPAALPPVCRPVSPVARETRAARCCRSRVHSPGHVAETDEQAKNELWPHYQVMINRIGGERGWPPASRDAIRARSRSRRRPVCRVT